MQEARDIDTALDRHWFALRLPPALETDFALWNQNACRQENRANLCVILVLTLCFAALDAWAEQLTMGLALRLGLQAPAILWGMWRLGREIPHHAMAYAACVPVAAVIVTSTLLGLAAPPEAEAIYLMATGVSIVAIVLTFRLRFRHAAVLCVANVALYAVLSLSGIDGTPTGQTVVIVTVMSVLSLASLIIVARRERADQDIYLLKRRSELQTTELQRLVSELSRLSDLDALTGIGNRRCFERACERLWTTAERSRTRLALALVDIDHFKAVNDIAGHGEGDRCLRLVAQALEALIRPACDVATRFGGEEFAVLIPLPSDERSALDTADMLGESLRKGVERLSLPHPGSPSQSVVTVSVGVALACPGRRGDTVEALLEAADRALYDAKRRGRNRVTRVVIESVSAAA